MVELAELVEPEELVGLELLQRDSLPVVELEAVQPREQ